MIRAILSALTVGAILASGPARAKPASDAPAVSDRQRSCPAAPSLALLREFKDPRRFFTSTAPAFRTVEKRFAAAYRIACRSGLLTGPLVRPGASDPGRLFLRNAPDANTTSIYRDGGEGEGAAPRPTVMEHPFIGHDGRVDIPSADQIRSAIVCSVHHANPPSGPAGDILECLVD